MLRRQVLTLFLAVLLVVFLVYGVERLFALRFQQGDVYPAYSTLRMDPVGAKALYEAFAALPQVSASRNYQPLPRLHPAAPVTLVYAGVARRDSWSPRELEALDALVSTGSRVVFSFLPVPQISKHHPPAKNAEPVKSTPEAEPTTPETGDNPEGKDQPEPSNAPGKQASMDARDRFKSGGKSPKDKTTPEERKKADDESERPLEMPVSFDKVAKSWGFQFATAEGERPGAFTGKALPPEGVPDLEPVLSWHSALYFTNVKPAWKTLYACDGKPVVIERPWGRGSIVAASDSFFLSNEALLKERSPRLLAALAGPPAIIFDEEHHGLSEEMNLAGLAIKYRLQGVFAGLVLMAALFVWQHIVRFVPAYQNADGEQNLVSGQDAAEGFVNLLRRSIPASRILEICGREWRKTFGAQSGDLAKFETAEAEAAERDSVAAYAFIAERLQRPKALPASSTSKHP